MNYLSHSNKIRRFELFILGKKRIITQSGEADKSAGGAGGFGTPKKSVSHQVINATAFVHVSYNNTIISITDSRGGVLAWASAGSLGFKGTKKSTPYAASLVAKNAVDKARKFNINNLRIVIRGIGPARDSAIRGLAGTGLNITSIMDDTPVPHNGVRSTKPRRV